MTRPTGFPEENWKEHVPDDPYPDPSFSDLSSKKKKHDSKKKHSKYRKDDSSDPSSSDNSHSSDDSDYICKTRKRNIYRKKDLIKLCARLTAKFLTTAYK